MERGAERREPIEKRYKEALPAYCFHKLYADRPFGPGLKVKVAAQYTQFGCRREHDRITLRCLRQWGEFSRRFRLSVVLG